jgi:hypothetical protein
VVADVQSEILSKATMEKEDVDAEACIDGTKKKLFPFFDALISRKPASTPKEYDLTESEYRARNDG